MTTDYDLNTRVYEEKVYAGVLGKIIGVYLGRPFEQWSNERIESELGEITGYTHERLGQPLIVTDDDISGTFTFFRSLTENGCDPDLTPAQIGDWWLNTIIEGRTILWWGGFGISTEHTAFLRLKAGLKAPASGSAATNGRAVAEEIGAQIFIDGWGLIAPGDPARAVDWARRGASVSHDSEAIYGAQVVAALISLAFVGSDIRAMLDTAAEFIPPDSLISELIADMKVWATDNGDDWRATLTRIHGKYPYARFGTNCPMVSNHAIILLALLHGGSDFSRSLMIANTAGYDTDCNSGNVGCILGVMNGLGGMEGGVTDWRGPVADRLYLPTADGGRSITDAVRESLEIVNTARALRSLSPLRPKDGARFHFSPPGSVQGWEGDGLTVRNVSGRLALGFGGGVTARAGTATFAALEMGGYDLIASPTLYPGQTITAAVQAAGTPCSARLYVKTSGDGSAPVLYPGPSQALGAGEAAEFAFTVPDTDGRPVHEVGLELSADAPGTVFLDRLTWGGPPQVTFRRPGVGGAAWRLAWVNGADQFSTDWASPGWTYRVIQNAGVGLVTQGEASWRDYTVGVDVWPHLAHRIGLCAACRGLRRYVALVLDADKRIRLVRQHDDARTVLAESDRAWAYEQKLSLSLTVSGSRVSASIDGHRLSTEEAGMSLSGAVGLLVEQGNADFGAVEVRPARAPLTI
jgi:ADP-ribosylglycohydrolase